MSSNAYSDNDGWEVITKKVSKVTLGEINREYLKKIKPIFEKKCLNCHGSNRKLPWYFSVPGPKHLMQYDIREAREHMDMSHDFPFKGHGTAKDDLEALGKTIKKGNMPPLRYLLLHWDSSLEDFEKIEIEKWINHSLKLLKKE